MEGKKCDGGTEGSCYKESKTQNAGIELKKEETNGGSTGWY
jgi:hypothetical protein